MSKTTIFQAFLMFYFGPFYPWLLHPTKNIRFTPNRDSGIMVSTKQAITEYS